MNTKNSVALASSGILLATAAFAQETSVSVTAGVTYSDNIGRVSQNEQSETMPEAGLLLNLNRDGRLTTDLSADLLYRTYSDSDFDDELLGGLDANLSYMFSPDRFSWTITDNYGQVLVDPQAVESPENRQNLNFFSTGPDITVPLSDRTSLAISGRWSDVDYEDSDFGNQRLAGSVALIRNFGATSSFSVNAVAERVEYDESPTYSDYDLQSAYLAYEAAGVRTRLVLRGGYTALHDSGDTSDDPLLSVSLTRELTARSTLTLNAGTELISTEDAFRRDRGYSGVTGGTEDAIASRDVFQQDYASIAWNLSGERTSLQLSGDWRREDHEIDASLDRDLLGGGFSLSRRVKPRLTAELFGYYSSEEFDLSGVEFDDWSAGAEINWNFSRNYSVSLRAEHYGGSGDTPDGSGLRDYDENLYTLTFAYSSRP